MSLKNTPDTSSINYESEEDYSNYIEYPGDSNSNNANDDNNSDDKNSDNSNNDDSSDGIQTEEDANGICEMLFNTLKDKFGAKDAKRIIQNSLKKTDLTNKVERDSPHVVENINIDLLKKQSTLLLMQLSITELSKVPVAHQTIFWQTVYACITKFNNLMSQNHLHK